MQTLLRTLTAALLTSSALLGGTAPKDLDAALDAFRAADYERTIELAGAIEEGSDDYARARYLLGETHLLVHAAPAAERAFHATLEKRPRAVPAMVGLGRALLAQDQAGEAEVHVRAALELDADDPAARRTLAELLMNDSERRAEAGELLRSLHEADPGPANTRALVRLLVLEERLDAAAEVAGQLVRSSPEHPMGPFLLGLVRERQGDEEAAIRAYRAALERDERFLDAHKNLAILGHTLSDTYQIAERNELALAHYGRYFELGGRDPKLESNYQQLKGFLGSR